MTRMIEQGFVESSAESEMRTTSTYISALVGGVEGAIQASKTRYGLACFLLTAAKMGSWSTG